MAKTLPTRDQVAPEDTWDLSKMYADRESWEEDLKQAQEMGKKLADQAMSATARRACWRSLESRPPCTAS